MIDQIKEWLAKDAFLITPLSIVINPSYIIRGGLLRSISKLAPGIDGDILDFGCGSKPYQTLFSNASSYIGLDIQVSGHDHKKSKVDYFYNGKQFPFADSSYDAVVSFEVFEHVFNLEEVLSEISRVLKPDGKLLLSIPFAWGEHEIPYDFARYTSYGITHILKDNGFEVQKVTKTTTYVQAVFQLIIEYFSKSVFPSWWPIKILVRLFLVFPLNLLALFFNALLPKRYDYFCNLVILAHKDSAD